jgi:hypothetical protein
VTFRLIWTAVLAVPLCLGCGDSSRSKENRTTGRGNDESSDAAPQGNANPDADAGTPETELALSEGTDDDAGPAHEGETSVSPTLDDTTDAPDDVQPVRPESADPEAPSRAPVLFDNGLSFRLTDVTVEAGLSKAQWEVPPSTDGLPCYHALRVTGGAAAVDIDEDGWNDLFVTRLEAPNSLYLNNGDGTFRDVAPEAGLDVTRWSNSPAFADVDHDFDLDLFVTTAGPAKSMLFINQGDGTFSEEAELRGVAVGHTDACSELTSATFGDYNHDGAMDLYVSHWTSGSDDFNRLFRNDGTGHFTDVTDEAGLRLREPRGYSSGFMDADGDGWEDLFVVADFGYSELFHNNHDGTFARVTVSAGVGLEEDGMGGALGDVNDDGLPDWFVSNVDEPGVTIGNRLYVNRGDGTFDDQTETYGVRQGGWGWGALLFDIDNDGNLDASNVNGWITGDELPSLWLGDTLPWRNVSASAGLTQPMNGRAYVAFDFDRDGDQDIFVARNGDAPVLYRNDLAEPKHWLTVKGLGSYSSTHGIGTRVEVESVSGRVQVGWITSNNNFLGHVPLEAHFGWGDDEGPYTVRVFWPASGKTSSHGSVRADQVITLQEL